MVVTFCDSYRMQAPLSSTSPQQEIVRLYRRIIEGQVALSLHRFLYFQFVAL